jgi:hypothetical protein
MFAGFRRVRVHHSKGEFIGVAVAGDFFEALDLGLFCVVVFGAEGVVLQR